MNKEQQRIAIAELCGWRRIGLIEGCYELMGEMPPMRGWVKIPDYLNDLNAMHEAEKVMTDDQRGQAMDALCEIVRRDHNPEAGPMTAIIAAFFSTASQRAEAFLRAMGKWQE